jgi:DNA modification methylase
MITHVDTIRLFEKINVNPYWAFSDKSRKETTYITHGHHRYPAKFIPQIVSSLIEKYTRKGDLVADPFGGCGTTLVESKVMGRPSVGVDINPVAVLITKAKITTIEPLKLEKAFVDLKRKFGKYNLRMKVDAPEHERIDYWFRPEEKRKLAFIFTEVSKLKDQSVRDFFYCGFSNILKNCSIWLQKSNKPTRDFSKKPDDPFLAFSRQAKRMLRGHAEFYNLLDERKFSKTPCRIYCADARKIPVKSDSVSLIVTSPPYVTSYEYADLHQLTALWFEYAKDLGDFRKRFIGTAYHRKKELRLNSHIADRIRNELSMKDRKTAEEVATYFSEMNEAFGEMKRVLRKDGKACIVIGNTSLKGVAVLNAEVFIEQMGNLGFAIEDIIKREIPSKNLPSLRDKKTGRFAKATDKNRIYAYPTEYIIIMKKL